MHILKPRSLQVHMAAGLFPTFPARDCVSLLLKLDFWHWQLTFRDRSRTEAKFSASNAWRCFNKTCHYELVNAPHLR
jgi:hypothetical protein